MKAVLKVVLKAYMKVRLSADCLVDSVAAVLANLLEFCWAELKDANSAAQTVVLWDETLVVLRVVH